MKARVILALAVLGLMTFAECSYIACPRIYRPVCGSDGKTYPNRRIARCARVEVARMGKCDDDPTPATMQVQSTTPAGPCICTLDYNPVCGSDGRTYGNPCGADCAGIGVVADGPCPVQPTTTPALHCICTLEYVPVCGSDGMTYGNSCNADCAGVPVAYTGVCGGDQPPLSLGRR